MPTTISYGIDADDIVTQTGLDWDVFARANEAPELCSLPGDRTLWSYIADDATLELWQRLVQRVRDTGDPVEVPLRCDGPHQRRWFTMNLELSDGASAVHFCARLRHEEERDSIALLARGARRDLGESMVRVCAWCGRCGDGEDWVEIEQFVERYRLFARPTVNPITHAICPRCEASVMAPPNPP